MNKDIIRIREIEGAQILDTMNCAAISKRFFHRSRAWFIQRLNNNNVNGKPVSFTPDELFTLRTSLKVLASEITDFASNIPNLPSEHSIRVYIIDDPTLIKFYHANDIDGFKKHLGEDDTIIFPEANRFDSEAEARTFCSGIIYGNDTPGQAERLPLSSCRPADLPYIEALENHTINNTR